MKGEEEDSKTGARPKKLVDSVHDMRKYKCISFINVTQRQQNGSEKKTQHRNNLMNLLIALFQMLLATLGVFLCSVFVCTFSQSF